MRLSLKKIISFFVFFSVIVFQHTLYAQTRIEDAIKKNSKHKFKSIDELANFISSNADDDREKAYGVYYWIATNVVYDVKKFMKGKPSFSKPEKVFEKGKAVCEGYANLFKELCKQMKLNCEVIAGYSKGYGYQPGKPFTEADHAWNAVQIGAEWHLIDVTWAAGSIKKTLFGARFVTEFNNDFFFLPPKEFVITHLPEVPMWQMLNNPVPIKVFSASNEKIYAHLKTTNPTNYNSGDTVNNFFSMKVPERSIKYGAMALEFNPQNIVPLALSVIVPLKYKLENTYFTFYDKTVRQTDSIIGMAANAVELLKNNKSSKESVKELVAINLINGYEVLSELYFIKSELIKKKEKTSANFDSLLVTSKPTIESLEKSVLLNRETKNTKQFEKTDAALCNTYKTYLDQYSAFLSKETDEKKKKNIQKEIIETNRSAKKIIISNNSCFGLVKTLK